MSDLRISVTVVRVTQETGHIKSFLLRRSDGGTLPACGAGDHIDVHLPGGLVRQYSLCNGPTDTGEYLIGVKSEPASRGGSRALHEQVQVGSVLEISPPRSSFPLVPHGTRYLLLAGGIGITPILSMARHLAAAGTGFALHYFTQGAAHTPFRAMLDSAELSPHVTLHAGLDPSAVEGVLGKLLAEARPAQLYYCGPAPFMELTGRLARELAWPTADVHYEYFSPLSPAGGTAFQLELAKSGRSFTIPPERTIIEVLDQHGIAVPTSCGQGVCGTCVVKVLAGQPEHRDSFLSEFQKNSGKRIALCVSRSNSGTLVIDL